MRIVLDFIESAAKVPLEPQSAKSKALAADQHSLFSLHLKAPKSMGHSIVTLTLKLYANLLRPKLT